MKSILEQAIARAANVYVKGNLKGGKTLAKLLGQAIDFRKGTVAVLTPTKLTENEICEFQFGHSPPAKGLGRWVRVGRISGLAFPVIEANAELVGLIHDLLQGPKAVCLMENSRAAPDDPWLKRAKSSIAILDKEVYHVLTHQNRSKGAIQAGIREAKSIPRSVGALGLLPEHRVSQITSQKVITKEYLRTFAATVHFLFVGAYDGEGYIMWEKSPANS